MAPRVPSYFDPAAQLKLDPSQTPDGGKGDRVWYDAQDLRIEGKGWKDTETFYERLPERAKSQVTPAVRGLCSNSSGIVVRFVSDAKKLKASWKTGAFDMKHMAATGIRGLDLYARIDERWKFQGTAVPSRDSFSSTTIGLFMPELPEGPTEYMLYLPLYDSITNLKIGVPRESFIASVPPRPTDRAKPIVFYGTSITQGGCASRAGMSHPAILGRWLDREIINLGFSGSGKMEPEMAQLLSELDPCLYVLECLPNLKTEMVGERVEPFVKVLRKAHPETPILLVENPCFPLNNSGNKELQKVYQKLLKDGVEHLFYLPGDTQLSGIEEGTVDGVHPTDLGFERMALTYYPVIEKILSPER